MIAILFLATPQAWVLAIGALLFISTTATVLLGLAAYQVTTRPSRQYPAGDAGPAIPRDRQHPLYSIGGGRVGPDHTTLTGRHR